MITMLPPQTPAQPKRTSHSQSQSHSPSYAWSTDISDLVSLSITLAKLQNSTPAVRSSTRLRAASVVSPQVKFSRHKVCKQFPQTQIEFPLRFSPPDELQMFETFNTIYS